MTDNATGEGRVAVYLDFDNVVISRREQSNRDGVDSSVDLDAILDFASSFGTVATSRAYADWSRAENAAYQQQLVRRAVFLVQMFTTSGKIKNGADIRLAIDVVEDLSLFPDITHVVVVAGDSDYIPLAQHVKRYGRYMVGIGVAGSISKNLASACDEYWDYDNLPGLHTDGDEDDEAEADSAEESSENAAAPALDVLESALDEATASRSGGPSGRGNSRGSRRARLATGSASVDTKSGDAAAGTAGDASTHAPEPQPTAVPSPISRSRATQLLLRAVEFGASKTQHDWQSTSAVKNQILRMEPSFQESALGFTKFTDFLRSRGNIVEYDDKRQKVRIREPRS